MKILFVVHYYLPRHQAGTEIYTAALAGSLAERHEVAIFTSEDGPDFQPVLEKRVENGLTVWQARYSMPLSYEETFRNPKIAALFETVLESFQPDVVHFQHAFRLGGDLLLAAQRRGAATVVTLADYWFLCPQTQLLLPTGERCWGPESGMKCLSCPNASRHIHALNRDLPAAIPPRLRGRLFRALHGLKAILPSRWWRGLRDFYFRLRGKRGSDESATRATVDRLVFLKHVLDQADAIIAPSRFLADRYRAEGIGRSTMDVSDYGFRVERYRGKEEGRRKRETIHFGFIGTLTRHKGVHVLIEAFNGLQNPNAYLHIYGDPRVDPPYTSQLESMIVNPRIGWMGRFENEAVGDILMDLDLLIAPSIWWENSPLTIHEAFLAGVPVAASDIGGMAELVKDGVNGRLFRAGDSNHLREVLKSIVENPSVLAEWGKSVPKVKEIRENAGEMERLYERLAVKKRG